jgi:hypothetical protein
MPVAVHCPLSAAAAAASYAAAAYADMSTGRVCCCCSGTITVDEMRDGLRAKGSKIPESELQRIMENADVNGEPAAAGGNTTASTAQYASWRRGVASLGGMTMWLGYTRPLALP